VKQIFCGEFDGYGGGGIEIIGEELKSSLPTTVRGEYAHICPVSQECIAIVCPKDKSPVDRDEY